jgi:pyruvate carboxylase
MRALGDKASARNLAIEAGVPVIPATEVRCPTTWTRSSQAGRRDRLSGDAEGLLGRRRARHAAVIGPKTSWRRRCREGRREAEAAFGNGEGYLEKMIERARHVEVQILGDSHGNMYTCSSATARPAAQPEGRGTRARPLSDDAQRRRSASYGLKIGKHGYRMRGTVEFLMDMDTGAFYFIEVNPRVQVEHTVTEEVTGIDIVRAQIHIAEGATIGRGHGRSGQDDVRSTATRCSAGSPPRIRRTTSSPITAASPPIAARPAWASASMAAPPIPAR